MLSCNLKNSTDHKEPKQVPNIAIIINSMWCLIYIDKLDSNHYYIIKFMII